jgi:hypothetical protein
MQSLIEQFGWAINVFLIVLILYAFYQLVGATPIALLKSIVKEFGELREFHFSAAAINALALLVIFLFGLVIMVAGALGSLQRILIDYLGYDRAEDYAASVNPITLLLVLVAFAVVSLLVVSHKE